MNEARLHEEKNRLSKWPIEEVRTLYRKAALGRVGTRNPPTTEEIVAGELLDEHSRKTELAEYSKPALQAIVAREESLLEEQRTLDYRLALEILEERS